MVVPIGQPRPCKGCGISIDRKKFCANSCRDEWYRRTQPERTEAARRAKGIPARKWLTPPPISYCKECGASFPGRSGRTESGLKEYCSKICAAAARKVYVDAETQRKAAKERYYRKRGRRSRGELRIERERQREAVAQSREVELASLTCSDCACPTPHNVDILGRRKALCQQCIGRRSKVYKRSHRKAYKARLRGVRVETFDPIEVLSRDGWRCHLCGRKTPQRFRGTYRDDAPELDHIIPLSKGGEHSRANTACACRKCNIAKGGEVRGQLSLLNLAA